MKKIFILILFIFVTSICFSQSTEQIINNFDGEFDIYTKKIDDSFISMTFGLGLSTIPIILYPISVFSKNMEQNPKLKKDLTISYQVFAVSSVLIWATSIIANSVYKEKAKNVIEKKYEYQKIISKDLDEEEIIENINREDNIYDN